MKWSVLGILVVMLLSNALYSQELPFRKGAEGEKVKNLQRLLDAYEFDLGNELQTGVFGKQTEAATRKMFNSETINQPLYEIIEYETLLFEIDNFLRQNYPAPHCYRAQIQTKGTLLTYKIGRSSKRRLLLENVTRVHYAEGRSSKGSCYMLWFEAGNSNALRISLPSEEAALKVQTKFERVVELAAKPLIKEKSKRRIIFQKN